MKLKFLCTLALALGCAFLLPAQEAVTVSGSKVTTARPGSGATPRTGQEVFLNSAVLDQDGKQVFTTKELGFPWHHTLGKESDSESKALDEAIMKMQKGGAYRVEIPKRIANPDNPYKDVAVGDYMIFSMELVGFQDARPSGTDVVVTAAKNNGAGAARAQFDALQKSNPKGYVFEQWDMNMAGYKLLGEKKTDAAIEVFKMNTELNPKSWNAWDSLGDGYIAKGDKENAIESLRKALSINPDFTGSKEKLDQLTK